MLDVVFEFPDIFDAYKRQLQDTPRAVEAFLNGTMRNYLEQQKAQRLQKVPGPVARPIQWTPAQQQNKPPNVRYSGQSYYSKQKAAYFATNGFGRGIPTQRTGAIVSDWQVVIDLAGASIGYLNINPAAKFVIGTFQQKFHANTGWQREDLEALVILTDPAIDDMLLEGWLSIVDIEKSLI